MAIEQEIRIVKCEPLQCERWKRLFEKLYMKTLADRLFLDCPHRKYPIICMNEGAKHGEIDQK